MRATVRKYTSRPVGDELLNSLLELLDTVLDLLELCCLALSDSWSPACLLLLELLTLLWYSSTIAW